MMGVTPASAYCGAKLVESGRASTRRSWRRSSPASPATSAASAPRCSTASGSQFHARGVRGRTRAALDGRGRVPLPQGRARRTSTGPTWSATLHAASGYAKKARLHAPARPRRTRSSRELVASRDADHDPRPAARQGRRRRSRSTRSSPRRTCSGASWRPGMSEGALSEPAHRAVARAMNVLRRYCLREVPPGGTAAARGRRARSRTAARAASTSRASATATATAACSTRARASRSRR